MSEQTVGALAIQKEVTVACAPERAFQVFTEGVATWWPLATHSVAEEDAETVILEGREGGRFYERTKDGEEHDWGTVTVWEPPTFLALTWHPGRGPETAQQLEIRFTPEGDGTRVQIDHRGWETLGDRAEKVLGSYSSPTGWDFVLGERYANAAGS